MKLNNSTLAQIPISKPNYDRDEIGIGIVHFGVGGFHRAHQAMYIDRLLEKGLRQRVGHLRRRRHAGRPQDEGCPRRPGRPVHAGAREPGRQPRRAGDRVDRRLPLRPRRPRGRHRTAGRTDHPHHLADHHRGRLQRRAHRSRARSACSAWWPRPLRGAATADWRRRRSFRATTSRATARSRGRRSPPTPNAFIPGWRSGSPTNTRFPNSMVDRITPVTTPDVIDEAEGRVRRRGPVAGGGRAVHLLGARRRFLRRQAAAGGRRRAAGRRRDAVRADEAAAAQRQPPKPLLFRVSQRLPAGARRRGRPAVRRIPDALHGYRSDADAAAGAGDRPSRLQAHADRAVRQPRRARHHRPALLRLVGPHPQVAASR